MSTLVSLPVWCTDLVWPRDYQTLAPKFITQIQLKPNKTLKPLFPKPFLPFLRQPLLHHKLSLKVSSSAAPTAGEDTVGLLERCYLAEVTLSSVATKKGYGAFGAVTLEKSKLDTALPKTITAPELAVGGGSGNSGNNNKIGGGGGGGGDDGGDDDDYFDDFDDGDEGDEGGLFRRRIILPELFDRKFLDAVLKEWQKTVMDLPAGLRQAYEMGLLSSAQLVKYLSIIARPTTARFISRAIPQGMSRAFIGRMIADPAFLYKFFLEQAATVGVCAWSEVKTRKERIKQEWDLALINVLTVTTCNAIVAWSLAPCQSYGNIFKYDLQNTLQKLPNNLFEKSYPVREFNLQKRVQSFFFKAAELCMVGLTAGAVQGGLTNLCTRRKEGRLSVTVPTASNNALGYGAFLALYANLRYQLLWGMDRPMINYFDVIGVTLFLSTTLRVLNVQLGETSRLAWLGVEMDPLANSGDFLKAYSRPSELTAIQSSSNWFISKDAIVSGLQLLGIKQGQQGNATAEGGVPAPKARKRRIVRRKVSTSST